MSGTTTTYAYDGDGKRASQTVGAAATSYVYDVNTTLPNVLTDGTLKYVDGLSLAYAGDSSGTVQVYHADGLSSVRALTDGSGTVIQTYQTDPFGVPTQTQGSSTQPFQFTGQQRDGNGLIYLRARYDDPAIGRFMSRDVLPGRLAAPQTLNRYAYATNNPVVQVDPSGQEGVWEDEDDLYLVGSVGWHGVPSGEYGAEPYEFVYTSGVPSESGLEDAAGAPEQVGDQAISQTERDSYVDLTSPERRTHILEGDKTVGGHRAGTGIPGKSEFPASWSDDKIMHYISDVATDPQSTFIPSRGGRTIARGVREGIEIQVVIGSDGEIVTAYPANVPRNP